MSILSLCFLTGLICYKSFSLPTKIMYLYVSVSFITETLGYYSLYISSEKKVNFLLYNIYVPTSFLILSLFFYIIINNKNIKEIIYLLTFLLIFIHIFFIFDSINIKFDFRLFLLSIFLLSIYSILFLRQILYSEESIYLNPHFWIVTGILFFYSGYFFLSGFINYISLKDPALARKLYTINHLLNIIYYSLVTYGFICQRRLTKLSS